MMTSKPPESDRPGVGEGSRAEAPDERAVAVSMSEADAGLTARCAAGTVT
jgi:hypothetical protein